MSVKGGVMDSWFQIYNAYRLCGDIYDDVKQYLDFTLHFSENLVNIRLSWKHYKNEAEGC